MEPVVIVCLSPAAGDCLALDITLVSSPGSYPSFPEQIMYQVMDGVHNSLAAKIGTARVR